MTRREELAGPPRDLETMVTRRTYREDAVYTILLAPRLGADPAFSLDAIAGAMREPRFQPYLGRKSCPPALPLFPLLSQTAEGAAALAEADIRWSGDDLLASLLDPGPQSLHWDHDFPMGLAADRETWRRDEPGDRGRWQFTERLEYAGWWRPAKGGEA
jgi:CRISPR system Cascade subunit CasD